MVVKVGGRGVFHACRSASQFNPVSLFGAGDVGALFKATPDTLFQNFGGTGAVTASGDPVGYMADQSGNGQTATQSTAGSRPLYRIDGNGLPYLEFDGVDDFMNFTGFTAGASTIAVAGKIRSVGAGKVAVCTTNQITYLDRSGSGNFGTYNGLDISSSFTTLTNKSLILRSRAFNDIDMFGNYTKETFATGTTYNARVAGRLGSEAGTGFANCDLYAAFAINRVLTDTEITNLTRYLLASMGQ